MEGSGGNRPLARMPATLNGSGIRETTAQPFRIEPASRVEHPNCSKNSGPSPDIVRTLRKGLSDLMRSHRSFQSGKCLDRARFTALLSGLDPMTTTTGTLHLFWIFHGSMRLNPPKVTPDNKIGSCVERPRRSSAFLVASSPSTVIQVVLSWRKCGPLSQTARSGAYLTFSSVFSGKGPSSMPIHLETGLMFEDAPWRIV
jgi:hypothetical protein